MQSDVPNEAWLAPSSEQIEELGRLIGGHRIAQALHVVAILGIADLLKDDPRDVAELASATSTHADALYRVLRFLAGVGIFIEVTPRRFGLTALGAGLRTDAPGSGAVLARFLLDEALWRPWGACCTPFAPAKTPSTLCTEWASSTMSISIPTSARHFSER